MFNKDYYKLLGIPSKATADEIKKSYRKMALKYHPDKNPGNKNAEDKFKEVTEAYQILSNSDERKKYDQFFQQQTQFYQKKYTQHPPPRQKNSQTSSSKTDSQSKQSDYQGFDWNQQNFSPKDIFNEVFGDFFFTNKSTTPNKASDLKYNLNLSLEEVCNGTEKLIHFIRQKNNKEEKVKLVINVPPGIKDQQKLKLRGEGDQGKDLTPGDLFVVINIKKHTLFNISGNDIIQKVPISFVDAILGTEIEVLTLTGKVNLKLPSGVKNDQIFRLKGKGLHDIKTKKMGDMLIYINIVLPQNASPSDKRILQELKGFANNSPLISDYNNNVQQIIKKRRP